MIRLVAGIAALLLAMPAAAVGQRCALQVTGTRDPTAYRPRPDDARCEGMYIGLQAEPLKVQPVSFVRGGLRLPAFTGSAPIPRLVALVRPLAPPAAAGPMMLLGRGAEANLNWALDADIRAGVTFNWNLSDVVLPAGLTDDRIGVFALADPTSAPQDGPVLVPLEVIAPDATPATRDDLELIVRIPGAAGARWSLEGDSVQRDAESLNADGFFRIWIPAGAPAGIGRIAITWRHRGQRGFNAVPELLRVALPAP